MFVKQIYTSCLSEASYFIESEREAAVIDPIRDSDVYLELAKERGATIRYIFETHFHADFISGHLELAERTGATIVFGPGAQTGYRSYTAKDQEVFSLGSLTLVALHTPGHTPESTSFLLRDKNSKNYAIFTGDTLFVGDVGRPDLAVKSNLTEKDLAGMLYDSIHEKIMPLEDDVLVYPSHGPGSACGKNIGKETWSTIGQQRKTNYALQPISRDKFIEVLTHGIISAPEYFSIAANINKSGYLSLENIISRTLKPLNFDELKYLIDSGCQIIDTRNPDDFERGFIGSSINIGLNGQFAIWAGTLLDYFTPTVLVCEPGKEREALVRLARVGFENVVGYLDGGIEAWKNAGGRIQSIASAEPSDMKGYINQGYEILDVRKPGEFEAGHIKGALNIHLQILEKELNQLDKNKNYLVHCAGGYRSMIACSIMKKHGFRNTINIYRGFNGIQESAGLEIETGSCEITQRMQKLQA